MAIKFIRLRYGLNPHQEDAWIILTRESPEIQFLNGSPGYINMLDALNGWQLVKELKSALDRPAAASFKHVSPSGAAVAGYRGFLPSELKSAYFVADMELSPLATAYARARGTDRVSSYGDFVALSDLCDLSTAQLIGKEVSDGVIAPGYDPDALKVLRAKRGGKYLIIQIDPDYEPPEAEDREVFGVTLQQSRNNEVVGNDFFRLHSREVTNSTMLSTYNQRDLTVALITLKYTQSNSICLAYDGQTIGVGAGQQSRIHCTRLAASKADMWWLRRHPRVLELTFREGMSRAEKNNAIDVFLLEDPTPQELAQNARDLPQAIRLTKEQRREWLDKMEQVVLASDAYFPFRDSIDRASQSGVQAIAEPGGSKRDEEVIAACNEHHIVMIDTNLRLFHH